jgi:hypothetical protein
MEVRPQRRAGGIMVTAGTDCHIMGYSRETAVAAKVPGHGQSLVRMDQVEPFDMTDAERTAWEAERRARKEWE